MKPVNLSKSDSLIRYSVVRLVSLVLLSALIVTPDAQADIGGKLLTVESGARSSAMGEAFVSISGDPLSQYYNPASSVGDKDTPGFSAYFGHTAYWENINFETAFFTLREGKTRFSLGARIAQVNDLEGRGATASAAPLYLFDSRDVSLKFGVAYPITEKLSAGLALGYLSERIDVFSTTVLNADLGLQYQQSEKLAFGVSVSNFGQDYRLDSQSISLPVTVRAGGSYRKSDLLLSADGVIIDSDFHAQFGAEYGVKHNGANRLFLRAGAQTGYDSKTFTAGLGFMQKDFRIDYAFVPYRNDLGQSHQFAISFFLK